MNEDKLLEDFKKEVCEKAKDIDPGDEYDWLALSIGFFIAKGADPALAHRLAMTARYGYQYWVDD